MPVEQNSESGLRRLFGGVAQSEVETAPKAAMLSQTASGQTPAPGQMYRRASGGSNANGALAELRDEIEQSRVELGEMLGKLLERKPLDQSVFDALHAELRDYKDDFFYERLKPIVRAFLFVFDAIEQFEAELTQRENDGLTRDSETLELTRRNLAYFRQQLTDALSTCEAFPLENPTALGKNTVRSGWTLNGKTLRAAEIVRGA